MYPGVIVEYDDQSNISSLVSATEVRNRPLFAALFTSDKGTEEWTRCTKDNFFKIYGKNVDVDEIRNFIYVYLRDTYITDSSIYMSNICTLIEEKYNSVKSIKYMGVNKFDASYQEFTYTVPEFTNKDIIYRFVPEQLNVTDIQIDLEEV